MTGPYIDIPLKVVSETGFASSLTYANEVLSRYDSAMLTRACVGFSLFLSRFDLSAYPSILIRMEGGVPISAKEMADFVSWTNRDLDSTIAYIDVLLETETGYSYDEVLGIYTPIDILMGIGIGVASADGVNVSGNVVSNTDITVQQRHTALSLVADYNRFLKGNSSSDLLGNFCSIFANPYKLLGLIDDIRNFSIPSMKEIVDGIKERVVSLIDNVIGFAKRKFENLRDSLMGMGKVFQRRIQSISEIFKADNIAKIKASIGQMINKAFSNFREVTQDVLAFLMYRMCKMASGLEWDLTSALSQLEQLKTTYEVQKNTLTNNSDMRSRAYLESGSVRFSFADRQEMRRAAAHDTNSYSNMGVDSLVERVIMQESGGDPNAVNSRTGASGLMQIMQATAEQPGFNVRPMNWDDRFDADENRRFGTDYLNAMLQHFNGDQVRALIAYNYGVGNAEKWEGDLSTLPPETQNYVSNIMGPPSESDVQPSVFVADDITEEELTWVNGLTAAGDPAYFTFDESVINMGSKTRADWERTKRSDYNAADNYDEAGWKQIVINNPSVFIMLRRVANRMGVVLPFNSCFRSIYYNLHILGADTGKNSMHSKAMAVDVSTRNMDERQVVEFIKLCSQEGFLRINVYAPFIHVDIASANGRGNWQPDYRGSDAIKEAMQNHLQDRFRKG